MLTIAIAIAMLIKLFDRNHISTSGKHTASYVRNGDALSSKWQIVYPIIMYKYFWMDMDDDDVDDNDDDDRPPCHTCEDVISMVTSLAEFVPCDQVPAA